MSFGILCSVLLYVSQKLLPFMFVSMPFGYVKITLLGLETFKHGLIFINYLSVLFESLFEIKWLLRGPIFSFCVDEESTSWWNGFESTKVALLYKIVKCKNWKYLKTYGMSPCCEWSATSSPSRCGCSFRSQCIALNRKKIRWFVSYTYLRLCQSYLLIIGPFWVYTPNAWILWEPCYQLRSINLRVSHGAQITFLLPIFYRGACSIKQYSYSFYFLFLKKIIYYAIKF